MKYTLIDPKDRRFERLFLALPKSLYNRETLTQNDNTELRILRGTHPLSGDFEVHPFLLADERGKPAARCVLTYYPQSPKNQNKEAYLGFFECVKDLAACETMLNAVSEKAKNDGKTKITGPVDASFWIKYRFKTDFFDKPPYALEPYNREYYPEFWERCGFSLTQGYFSNQLRMPTADDHDPKCQKRFEVMSGRGYVIEYPNAENFEDKMRAVFELLARLYSTFPCYTEISWEKFYGMYSSIKNILCFDMAKLVYKDGKLAGFSISVPNFGNASCGRLSLAKIRKILRTKKYPSEFILIYMGVDGGHLGLGSMIAEAVKQSLEEKRCSAINALILDGKVTGESYYNSSLTTDRYHYALYRKEL